MKVFIDTSAWISLVAERDPYHNILAKEWFTLLNSGALPVTSSDVVSETITHLRYHTSHAVAVSFRQLLGEAVRGKQLVIQWVNEALFEEAWQIFLAYNDQALSMVDCTSFALCRREKIKKALTLDHHFSLAGLEVIPAL